MLEFLGDRVLNLAIAYRLVQLFPHASAAQLHAKYEFFTRNSNPSLIKGGPLYQVAKQLKLEKYIFKSRDEDLSLHGRRGKKLSHGKKTRENILSDHVEAILGALFLDGDGRQFRHVLQVIDSYWTPLGLNETGESESSFGKSTAFTPLSMLSQTLNIK